MCSASLLSKIMLARILWKQYLSLVYHHELWKPGTHEAKCAKAGLEPYTLTIQVTAHT